MTDSWASAVRRVRSYLIVGGEPLEREYVAGNVARAAGATLTRVDVALAAAGHACAALDLVSAEVQKPRAADTVLFFDAADLAFLSDMSTSGCPRCAEITSKEIGAILGRSGGIHVVAVRRRPRSLAADAWKPDTVVYLPTDSGLRGRLAAAGGPGVVRRGRRTTATQHQRA